MKLIVGLGNPGQSYAHTYHNIGALLIDRYAEALQIGRFAQIKADAEIWKHKLEQDDFILAKPLTYMNLSGQPVSRLMHYFKIPLENLLVIHDDLDLDFGKLRYREKGGHGGHNGIRNIIMQLGAANFKRLKFGIGRKANMPADRFVLSKITAEQFKILDSQCGVVSDFITDFISDKQLQIEP